MYTDLKKMSVKKLTLVGTVIGSVLQSNHDKNCLLSDLIDNKPETPFQTMTSQLSLFKPINLIQF